MNSPVRKIGGFTLLELLVAISIFAIVITSVYGTYRATFFNVNGTEQLMEVASKARVVMERISEDIELMHVGSDSFFLGEDNDIGGERADTLTYMSSANLVFTRNSKPAGSTILTYSVLEDDDSGLKQLYRSDVPVRPGGGVDQAGDDRGVVLCDGLQSFTLTYLAADGGESDAWRTGERQVADPRATEAKDLELPVAVRLEIRFAKEADSEESTLYRTVIVLPRISG